jgi:hypothetical protein
LIYSFCRDYHKPGACLANITGRESHILHLEVANEAWQNGFPGAQGIADLRAFTQYLAERTPVLVAITSNDDTSDQGIMTLYGGSAKGKEFVCFPMGILAGGVTLEARRPVRFQVIHPLDGTVVSNLTLAGEERCTLPRGPGAYVLKGTLRELSLNPPTSR